MCRHWSADPWSHDGQLRAKPCTEAISWTEWTRTWS